MTYKSTKMIKDRLHSNYSNYYWDYDCNCNDCSCNDYNNLLLDKKVY